MVGGGGGVVVVVIAALLVAVVVAACIWPSVPVPGLGLSPKLSSCTLPTADDGSPFTTEFELVVAAIVLTSAVFGTPDVYRNMLLFVEAAPCSECPCCGSRGTCVW